MIKVIKIIFASSFTLSISTIAITSVSCGNTNNNNEDTFLKFQEATTADAAHIMDSPIYSSFGVTSYWGTVGISDSETKKLTDNFTMNITNNIDSNNNLKTDVNGAFEEPFDTDAKNTVAMVFLKGKKGDSLNSVYNSSKVIFNSWNQKNYDSINWSNQNISPNYSINKFYDSLKTDQTQLTKIFGSNSINTKLMYSGASKFTLNSLKSESHLIYNNSSSRSLNLSDNNNYAITTKYTLSMTASDSSMKIVNINSDFWFKNGDTVPNSKNIIASNFSNT